MIPSLKNHLAATIILVISFGAHAQRTTDHQALYWIRYQNQLALSPKVYWVNEGENRRFFDPDVENQIIAHSHIHYKPNQWDFGGGLTLAWSYAQKPEIGYKHSAFEIRPFADASYEHQLGKIFLQNRLRVDNRFFESNPGRGIWEESSFLMRLRYRIQGRVVLKRKDQIPTIGLRFGDEIMLNTKQNTFDQNRIFGSVDFLILKQLSIEPSYVHVFQRALGKNEYFSRHIVRLSILHRI